MQAFDTPVVEAGRYFDEHYRPQTVWLGILWFLQTVVPIVVKYFWVDDSVL